MFLVVFAVAAALALFGILRALSGGNRVGGYSSAAPPPFFPPPAVDPYYSPVDPMIGIAAETAAVVATEAMMDAASQVNYQDPNFAQGAPFDNGGYDPNSSQDMGSAFDGGSSMDSGSFDSSGGF